jgi:phosphate-selective porin OprO/OprP
MRRVVALLILVLLPCAVHAQQPSDQTADQKEVRPDVRVNFPPPSIRIGEFRAALRIRLHADFRDFDPELGENEALFRRVRVGLQGRLYDDLEYEVEAELRDAQHPFRDVFLNYRRFRAAEVQVGRFKVPFSLEQTTSVSNINFVERSLIASQLAPGRDRGVMVHGRTAKDMLAYEAGIFRHDGDNTRYNGNSIDNLWAGRVVVTPWETSRGLLHSAQIGVAFTTGSLFEGLYGIRGRTISEYEFFEPVYVKGERRRLGVEARWTPGPILVQGEYIRVNDERNGQGLGDVDLPDALAQGWYVSGSWVLTGENKSGGSLTPSRPFPTKGLGAVELAARIEELRFGSDGTGGEPPFSNPRAANILPNRDRILTLGINWYLNEFGRITVNGTRETMQDPARTPLLGRTRFWGAVVRLQFVL